MKYRVEEYQRASCLFPGSPKKGWEWLGQSQEVNIEDSSVAELEGIPFADPRYPSRLRSLEYPPLFLFKRGELEPLRRTVGIVGARSADGYGAAVAKRLGRSLAEAGVVVVSGGARGIDTSAHEGVLEANGRGVIVSAGGLNHIVPKSSAQLFHGILNQGGALVSEIPDHVPPQRHFFLDRNRLIAALSDALVVVAARAQSGSLATARWAQRLGKSVFAVPGDLTFNLSMGTNQLIADGLATLFYHPKQLFKQEGEQYGNWRTWPKVGVHRVIRPEGEWSDGPVPVRLNTPVSGEDLRIQRMAEEHPVDAIAVSGRLGISLQEATSRLELLVLRGHLCPYPGNKYALSSPIPH